MHADKLTIKEIFSSAIEKGSLADRTTYLDDICGSDVHLRARVEELLKIHDADDNILDSPPVSIDTIVDNPPLEQFYVKCSGSHSA